MRTIVLLVFTLLLATAVASAQHGQRFEHPDNSAAVPSGETSITVSPAMVAASTNGAFFKKKEPTYQVIHDVVWWGILNADGDTVRRDLELRPETVQIVGNCPDVDSAATTEIFELLIQSAIAQGLAQGRLHCGVICNDGIPTVRVYIPACVRRTGSGCSTQFQSCQPITYAVQDYKICCPAGPGEPQITLIYSSSPGCAGGSGCEPTTMQ
jgi:hypothetical protein